MKILAFDPSGNWGKEGMGTTGFAVGTNLEDVELKDIKATDFDSKHAYWAEHRNLIEQEYPDVVVIESYRLFGHKAKEQTGSSLETAQLIGYLEMVCYDLKIPVVFQDPSTKTRHTDDILVKTGIIEKKGRSYLYEGEVTNMHKRDSLRHFLYFAKYGVKKLQS